jgi:hypothetical protein
MKASLLTVALVLASVGLVQTKDKDAALIGENFYAAAYVSGPVMGNPIHFCSLVLDADALRITDAYIQGWLLASIWKQAGLK